MGFKGQPNVNKNIKDDYTTLEKLEENNNNKN